MTLKTLAFLFIFNLSLANPPIESSATETVQRGNPSPQTILRRMAQAYAACSSYEDSGIVITTFDEETKGRIVKKPFKLRFKRPDRFRFEWTEYDASATGRLFVVWSNQAGTFTYWEPDRYEKNRSLRSGIAGATGVSSRAVRTIPELLIPDLVGWRITELRKPVRLSDEIFEGELCYHIRGSHPDGEPYEVWIGKKDYLLRKMRLWSTFPNFSTIRDEIHRGIKINQPIPDDRLEFKPPIALNDPKELPEGDITKELSNLDTLFEPDPSLWSEFVSEEGRFKMLMPSKPLVQTLTLESGQGKIVYHSFVAKNGGIVGLVNYADLPNASDPALSKEIFDEVRDQFLKQLEGKLQGEKTISLDGHRGREIKFNMYGGEGTIRVYLVNERLYQVAITIFTMPGKSEAGKYNDDVKRFLDSFQITTKSKLVGTLRILPFERSLSDR